MTRLPANAGANEVRSPEAARTVPRQRRWVRRAWMGVAAGLFWVLVLRVAMPAPTLSPELAISMSAGDKRQILAAVRKESYRQIWTALRVGQFKTAGGWFNSLWRHKVLSVAKQGDGDIWIHVGVQDRSQAQGYSIWSRHILRKQAGEWKIVWSF